MKSELDELLRCKEIIEHKLDWGSCESWQTTDFENLNQRILDETGVSLSISTLRRIWGRVEYNHLPSVTTLNTLAKFAGFDNWRNFVKKQNASEPKSLITDEKVKRSGSVIRLAWIVGILTLIGLASIFAFEKGEPQINKAEYKFSSQTATRGIPNSVIFTYNASNAPTDSVFIQQSWDNSKKVLVDKNLTKHTSIYYEPGFFTAKLIIGKQIVKAHKLLVSTDGWLGTIGGKTVPVYLENSEFMQSDKMQLPVAVIQKKNIEMQPEPPMTHFYNVGNFPAVPVKDFSFTTEVKNDYREGAGACQLTGITLLTDDIPIFIPLSAKGCVSELYILCLDQFISGKKADLSAFGVDFSTWNKITCRSEKGKIRYFVNEKMVMEFPLVKKEVKIIGLCYTFKGTGSVRNISLTSGGKSLFNAFQEKVILSKK